MRCSSSIPAAARGPSLQLLGEEAVRQLVTESRRVEEPAELGQAPGLGADLLGELTRRAALGRLSRDVELAGRQLEHCLADCAPVLADEQDVFAVALERHDAHGVEGPHDLTLERETVRPHEGAGDHAQPLARVPRPLPDLTEGGPVFARGGLRSPLRARRTELRRRSQEGTSSRS